MTKKKVPDKFEQPSDKIKIIDNRSKIQIHPDTDDPEVEVVFINVKDNIFREAEASKICLGKNGDDRLEQQEAYHKPDESSKNKEIRPNRKRANNNDGDNLEIDPKKRKKEDSVNKRKGDESISTEASTVDEHCHHDLPKTRKETAGKQSRNIKLQDVLADDNNTNGREQNNNSYQQQPSNHNFHGNLTFKNDLTSKKRYKINTVLQKVSFRACLVKRN